jgi:hypothetical protein
MISSGRKPFRGTRPSLVEPGPSLTSAWTDSAAEGHNNVRNLTYAQLDYCSTVWHVIDSRVDRELQWAKEAHHAPQMYPPGINGSCHVFSRRGGSSKIV